MTASAAASADDPPAAGGAVPGPRPLLGLLARIRRAGMQLAHSVTRIAQHKLLGRDVRRMAPAGFDATLTNAYVLEAVAWTAALRERLLALAGRPVAPLTPGLPRPQRTPRYRRTGEYFTIMYAPDPADRNDWPELAKRLRLGADGVAVAMLHIAGLSDRAVVTHICDYLSRAAMQLGAEADLPRIAALAAAAKALCPEDPEPETAPEAPAAAGQAADPGARPRAAGPPGAPAAGPPSHAAADDPPRGRPPDG